MNALALAQLISVGLSTATQILAATQQVQQLQERLSQQGRHTLTAEEQADVRAATDRLQQLVLQRLPGGQTG